MDLSKSQKRALFKIAMDLVKIDKQIHGNEVLALKQLQKQLNINQEEIDLAHYVTLAQAIECLKLLSTENRTNVIFILNKIIGADNDIDKRENLLLSAIQMALDENHKHYSTIISSMDCFAEMANNQIIYLESKTCTNARTILDNPYEFMLLSKILSETGIQFFYLPEIIKQLSRIKNSSESQLEILCKSLEYIIPFGTSTDLEQIQKSIESIDIHTFSQFICTHYQVYPPYSANLMITIQDGTVLDDDAQSHRCMDYLCIDVTQDIKQRLLTFIQLLDHPHFSISYQGYYKTLINYLSIERKINSAILITKQGDLRLIDISNKELTFTSAPQSKSLYVLLIKYGKNGISHTTWQDAKDRISKLMQTTWNLDEEIKRHLLAYRTNGGYLIYNLLTIYRYFSHRDTDCNRLLAYIRSIVAHKSSLKNYINTALDDFKGLANKEQYMVCYRAEDHSYYTWITAKTLYLETSGGNIPITESALWKSLI